MTDQAAAKLKYYLQLAGIVCALVTAIWAASLRPLTSELARKEAQKVVNEAQLANDQEHARIEHRTEVQLQEIKQTLKSIDERLYELATNQ